MRDLTRTFMCLSLLGGCLGAPEEGDYTEELGTDEEAARGGRRNTSPSATCSVSPNPTPTSSDFVVKR